MVIVTDVKWIKLSTQMFEDEKIRLIESMPGADSVLIIWIKLLAQAGKTNASGYIYLNEQIPYTEEMLATIFNRPLNTVRMALETFRNFGMIEITDGDFISISNWEKHQNIDGLEKIKEQNRIRKQRERARKKQLALGTGVSRDKNVTGHETITENHATELELDLELELEKEKDIIVVVENPFNFYQQNFGVLSPFISEDIEQWCQDTSDELVIEAMKITKKTNQQWRYAVGILKDWFSRNLKTLDDVQAYNKEYERKKQSRTGTAKIVPPIYPKEGENERGNGKHNEKPGGVQLFK